MASVTGVPTTPTSLSAKERCGFESFYNFSALFSRPEAFFLLPQQTVDLGDQRHQLIVVLFGRGERTQFHPLLLFFHGTLSTDQTGEGATTL